MYPQAQNRFFILWSGSLFLQCKYCFLMFRNCNSLVPKKTSYQYELPGDICDGDRCQRCLSNGLLQVIHKNILMCDQSFSCKDHLPKLLFLLVSLNLQSLAVSSQCYTRLVQQEIASMFEVSSINVIISLT